MNALFELGGAVNIWLSPAGQPYTCHDHADWAASQVLKVTLPPHSHQDVEAAKAYYMARGKVYERMFRRGWMRIAIQHDSKMLLTDGPRGTEAQWEWIYEKAGEDKLRVTDDQQNTIIDYRSNVQESVDPDDPERYVRDIGTTFGDWLKVQGFTLTNSDAVVDDFRIEGHIADDIPRSLRVIHFKDKVDYAGKPRGEWMLLIGGTTEQVEGDEGTIRGDVEYYLRHMGFVRSVPEAMVEVLLAEADPDDLDASAYMQQTFDLEDMFRSLGYQYGKAWPLDKMQRWYRQFIFDQPVDFSFGTPQNPRFIPVRGVVVYNFDKAGLRYSGLGRLERIEMAVGWLAGESCSPQENMDVNASQLFPALARMTHALEQWNKNFTTKNKTPEVVQQEVKEAVRAARMSQYDKSAWMAAREQHLRDATARLGEAEEPHTISKALRQGKDYYAPTMSPTLKVKFNVTPHPNRKGSGRSGWRKNRQLPPMPPKMEAADPDDINPQTYLDALPPVPPHEKRKVREWLSSQGYQNTSITKQYNTWVVYTVDFASVDGAKRNLQRALESVGLKVTHISTRQKDQEEGRSPVDQQWVHLWASVPTDMILPEYPYERNRQQESTGPDDVDPHDYLQSMPPHEKHVIRAALSAKGYQNVKVIKSYNRWQIYFVDFASPKGARLNLYNTLVKMGMAPIWDEMEVYKKDPDLSSHEQQWVWGRATVPVDKVIPERADEMVRESTNPDDVDPQAYLDAVPAPYKPGTYVQSKRLNYRYAGTGDKWSVNPAEAKLLSLEDANAYLEYFDRPGNPLMDKEPVIARREKSGLGEAQDPDAYFDPDYILPQMEADFPMWLKAQGFREDPAWRERGAEIDVWRKPGVMKSGTRFTMGSQAEIVVRNVKTGGKDVWQAQFYGPVTWGGPWGGTPTELRNYISTWLSRHMESGVQSCPRCQGVGTLNESWCECCDGTGVVTPERVKAFEHEAIV